MAQFTPPLVMSVHGIRTAAEWQHTLAEELGRQGIKFKHRRFGYYPMRHFLRSSQNKKLVDEFFTWYTQAIDSYKGEIELASPRKRPSVVAHSFGCFTIGYAMLKHKEIKFDKVILCGSILPSDFDWNTLFVRDQVGRVLNECGDDDVWVALAPYAVRGTGRSGRDGFAFLGSKCRNEFCIDCEHGDFFQPGHIAGTWLPFLTTEPNTLTTMHGSDIPSSAEFDRFIAQVRAIDRVRFGSLPGHETVAIPEGYSRQWRDVNPDIYTFLVDRSTNTACGYINAMPLEKQAYEDVLAGRVKDNEIPGQSVVPYLADQNLNLYLMSIAVAPSLGRAEGLYSEPIETLLDGLIGLLRRYARRNVRIDEVAAIGWSAEGMRLCERVFEMTQSGSVTTPTQASGAAQQTVEHPVYRLRLSPEALARQALRHRGLRRLLQAYEEMGR